MSTVGNKLKTVRQYLSPLTANTNIRGVPYWNTIHHLYLKTVKGTTIQGIKSLRGARPNGVKYLDRYSSLSYVKQTSKKS